MDLGLRDKVALVIGASRGIGQGIATSLAKEGAHLIICARGEEALQEAVRDLERQGTKVHGLALDITDPATPQQLVAAAQEKFGRLDILVGNAGGNRRGRFADTTEEDWNDILDLNLKSHLRMARAAIPAMRASGGGAMLFVASIFGREAGGAGLSIYNTTKSALISAAKIMAIELAGEGIRVNTIAPGSIRFEGGSWDRRVKQDPEGMAAFVDANLPLGRFGRVEEVADTAAFLVSERASLITGACITVDGSQSSSLI